ncbi:MAG: hypothetical protein V3R99_01155 [Thermoguttaceae bacterium]
MKTVCSACLILLATTTMAVASEEPLDDCRHELKVTEVPASVCKSLDLDPFYAKYVSVRGFPVVGSEKVSDYAMLEAGYLIDRMLADRPDVRDALIENKVRFAVMASTELTTDVPEHSDLKPDYFWDRRAGPRPCGPSGRLRSEAGPSIRLA